MKLKTFPFYKKMKYISLHMGRHHEAYSVPHVKVDKELSKELEAFNVYMPESPCSSERKPTMKIMWDKLRAMMAELCEANHHHHKYSGIKN